MRFFLIISIHCLFFQPVCAQQELRSIIPPSPTLASLAQYGNTTVGHYTGSPSISVPIYEVNTGDFRLPISLSYKASGIKVEELASWVGLGWSLNAGGAITRSLRGLPDEGGNGYFNPAHNILEVLSWPNYAWGPQDEYFRDIAQGLGDDTEPDIFYYNFGALSGKFYFHQETQEFICIPRNTIKIDFQYFLTTGDWKIQGDDGTIYYFELSEVNTNFSECGGNAGSPRNVTTGWLLTRIVTPIRKQTIMFHYDTVSYGIRNISSHTINQSLSGGMPQGINEIVICESRSYYHGHRLVEISYNSGSVQFIAETQRADLLGDKALDSVKVFLLDESEPFKTFAMEYHYFNQSNLPQEGSHTEASSLNVRLKLNSITEIGHDGKALPPYSFSYIQPDHLPSRVSYAQDVWGYYNGANQNQHMIPPLRIDNLYFAGANRRVNSDVTAYGTLNQITYPTGGYTLYEYENHKASGDYQFSQYESQVVKTIYLDQLDHTTGSVFIDSVLIDNNLSNGVFLDIIIDGILCDYSNGNPYCASMSLWSPTFSLPITGNVSNIFIPNGTYLLKADFSQNINPQQFEEFVIVLSWEEYESEYPEDGTIGGIRVKRITDFDDAGNQYVRAFDYTYPNGLSSGSVVMEKFFFEYQEYFSGFPDPNNTGILLVRSAYSNQAIGSTQGSNIGYNQVTETKTASGVNLGKTIFYFTTADEFPDIIADNSYTSLNQPTLGVGPTPYPFPPETSFDHRRGLLKKREDYKILQDSAILIYSIENEYAPLGINPQLLSYDVPMYHESTGVKAMPNGKIGNGTFPYAVISIYKIISEWVRPIKTTERTYLDDGLSLEIIKEYEYNNLEHLQVSGTRTISSNGIELLTRMTYPLDFPKVLGQPNDPSVSGIKYLQEQNIVNPVIESVTLRKLHNDSTEIIGATLTSYSPDRPVPLSIKVLDLTSPLSASFFSKTSIDTISWNLLNDSQYRSAIEYEKYDSHGNLLEQNKLHDIKHSYVWGYNSIYPIASVVNSSEENVFHTSFEDSSGTNGLSRTGNKYYNNTSYTIPVADRPTGSNLVMTYWYYDGSWKFQDEVGYNPVISKPSASRYDEVRVYPKGAQMTTYTYEPGIGISSVTDHNSFTNYYLYDNFGRLKLIKNDKGDVLQHYTYHYKEN